MPKPTEIAILNINGGLFRDWESVWVRQTFDEPPNYKFRFTCSEGSPIAKNYALLQIKPGDHCSITLAGQPAFTGRVTTRQVFYDAHRHHVEIQGASYDVVATDVSAVHPTHEENKKNFTQFAQKLFGSINVPFSTEGSIPGIQFPRISIMYNQRVYDAVEQLARHVGVHMTSDATQGGVVAFSGTRGGGGATFVEGKNILEGREIISNLSYAGQYAGGMLPAGDQKNGPDVHSVPFVDSSGSPSGGGGGGPSGVQQSGKDGTDMGMPAWIQDQMKMRTQYEGQKIDEDAIWVTVTVQGWLMNGGLYGPPGSQMTVNSPMLMMQGKSLMAKAITFTQDSFEGTRTTIELVNPAAQGGATGTLPSGG